MSYAYIQSKLTQRPNGHVYLSLFAINVTMSRVLQSMEWLDEDNLKSVVTIDPQSDCQGFLSTLVHHCGKSWKKYYCVLKGARLYFFVDSVTRFANGITIIHLFIYSFNNMFESLEVTYCVS